MNSPCIKIINGSIVLPDRILKEGTVIISGKKIEEITSRNIDIPGAIVMDARGNYVAPGCIDLHIHGGGGHNFTEGTPEAFVAITQAHARHGMTGIYPTLEATSIENRLAAIHTCESLMGKPTKGATILGLHLEGNYLNMQMKGGQPAQYISNPEPEEYKALLESTNCIKRWSVSPELPGALELGKYASEKGVLVSLAHTVADYPLVRKAFEAGYTHATHFYNAMTGVHREGEFKREGTIESIYLMDDITVELVADGIHVPPAILQLVHKLKGAEKTALVTDAMSAAAYPDFSRISESRVIIEDGVCKLADRSAIAGSIATSDRLIRTMVHQAELPLTEVIRMASEAPARIMNIFDKKGSLEKGKEADIIIFDPDINLQMTIIEGEVVYRKS